MIERAEELLPRVRALLGDTAELRTAAGLGFVAATPAVSERAAPALAQPSWHVLDLRSRAVAGLGPPPDDVVRQKLDGALALKMPLILLVDDEAPRMALRFARAFADRRRGGPSTVDLGDRREHAIDAAQSLVVVVDGIGAHAALPTELQQVDFWEFLA